MRTPAVQNMVAKKLARQLSEKLHTQITIERARYGLKRNLILRNFLMLDQQADTLLFVERLDLKLKKLEIVKKTFEVSHIDIKNMVSHIRQFNDSTYNYSFLLTDLTSDSTSNTSWSFTVNEINLENNTFLYVHDTTRFLIKNLSAGFDDISYDSTLLHFNLNSFAFGTNKNFDVKNITFNFNLSPKRISFDELSLLGNHSFVTIDKFFISKENPLQIPVFHFNNIKSKLFLHEFSDVFPEFSKSTEYISISGNVISNLKSIKAENLEFAYGDHSHLNASFVVHNFLKADSLQYSFSITDLNFLSTDITKVAAAYVKVDTTSWYHYAAALKKIGYKGTITGTSEFINAEGSLNSALGLIQTKVVLNKQSLKKTGIEGTIKAAPLYPSVIIDNKVISDIAFNLNTHGYFSTTDGINMEIDGMIQHLGFNGQSIDSVGIKGAIDKEMFTGRISSFDPKIRFDFDGKLNFDSIPSYNFSMNMYYVNMFQLGFNKSDSLASLSFDFSANFIGNKFENSSGDISLTNLYYFYDTSYFATDSISVHIEPSQKGKKFNFSSEYISAELEGHFNTLTVVDEIQSLLHHHLPSLGKAGKKASTNNFIFTLVADYPHPLTELVSPELRISPGSIITGRFDGNKNDLNFSVFSNRVEFYNRRIDELNLKAYTKSNRLFINIDSKEFRYAENTSLKNFMSSFTIFNDSIKLNFNWNNWHENNYSGNLNSLVTFTKNNQDYNLKLDIYPSNIVVQDTIWYLSKSQLLKDSSGITISDFKIDNSYSAIKVTGKISENLSDSLQIELERLNLAYLNPVIKDDYLILGGSITGKTVVKDITRNIQINSTFAIENLSLNHELIGNTFIDSRWDQTHKKLDLNFKSLLHNEPKIIANGYYQVPEKFLDLDVQLKNQTLKLLSPFLEPTFTQIEGNLTGNVKLFGSFPDLQWKGSVFTDNTSFLLSTNMVNYQIKDSIYLNNFSLLFNNTHVYDKDNNQAIVTGSITHQQFSDFFIDLKVNTSQILGLNTKVTDNPLFYGKVYGSGYVKIYGSTDAINIDISATTLSNSDFYIPLEGKSDIEENSFIEFYNPLEAKKSDSEQQIIKIENESEVNLIMDLTVTPGVEVQIIFDPKIGDALKANGYAKLNMVSVKSGFSMFGDYQISKGEFTFALQNVIHKKFEILAGSNVSWSGDPVDAQINLDAIYKIRKASVYDLTFDDADKEKKVEVDCHLKMADRLMNPTISFAVQVPSTTNEAAIDQINTLPEEEINKQVLSLLLVNKFMPLYQQSYAPNTSGGLGATTVSELLSKQLSKWFSQINTNFDLGFVYRPGSETTEQEIEFALSTNLWNDRITLNSNLGYTVQNQLTTTSKNPYTTDFQIEFKVNKKGNIRLRAFQKVNSDIEFSQAPYTQGIGIFYTEEFDDFNDLMIKMLRKSYAFKPEEPEIQAD